MCGVLPSLFGGIAFRRQIYQLFKLKDLVQRLDYDDILNGNGVNKLAYGSFFITCILALFFVFALGFDSISFYKNNLSIAGKYLVNREIIELAGFINVNTNMYIFARLRMYKITHFPTLNDALIGRSHQ